MTLCLLLYTLYMSYFARGLDLHGLQGHAKHPSWTTVTPRSISWMICWPPPLFNRYSAGEAKRMPA